MIVVRWNIFFCPKDLLKETECQDLCDGGSKMQKLDFDRCRRREDFPTTHYCKKAFAISLCASLSFLLCSASKVLCVLTLGEAG